MEHTQLNLKMIIILIKELTLTHVKCNKPLEFSSTSFEQAALPILLTAQ